MADQLTLKYGRDADVLHIDIRPPYAGQESVLLDDEIVARLNPVTKAVETLEVLFFSRRLDRGELTRLPLISSLKLDPAPGTAER